MSEILKLKYKVGEIDLRQKVLPRKLSYSASIS